MRLGERIYELRTGRGMSQGDLADALDVSRQAVSKWENDSAVPDLDKLLKISDLFCVSLDTLVKGKSDEPQLPTEPETQTQVVVVKQPMPKRKIFGFVFLGMAFFVGLGLFLLGGIIEGLLYSAPLVIFGLICLLCEKHAGLKCLWLFFLFELAFTTYSTGISALNVRHTLSWTADMNYGRLAIAWVLFIFHLFIVVFTGIRLANEPRRTQGGEKKGLILSLTGVGAAFAASICADAVMLKVFREISEDGVFSRAFSTAFGISSVVSQYLIAVALMAALVFIIRYKNVSRPGKVK